MKLILSTLAILFLCIFVSVAQKPQRSQKPKGEDRFVTTNFAVVIDCGSCAQKIMNVVPFQRGVRDVVVDIDAQNVAVEYDSTRTNVVKLVEAFGKVKLEATPKTDHASKPETATKSTSE